MAALQRGAFEGWRPGKLVLGAAWGLGLGLTGAGLWLQWSSGFAPRAWVFAQAIHELGAVPLAVAIGLSVLAIERRGGASAVVDAVANLGRMAFSAYLMHSLVGTLVFGGHGLGLFGTWGRGALLVAAFVFWSGQVLVARWWSARFRVGPLEALWRGLVRGDFSLGSRAPQASR
ncbi:MAG: DUF418 domain-containing protein [Polyangiaceae bacterium]|nr:DUF418 domain-containing protein [Polyangiaceae bacterium]